MRAMSFTRLSAATLLLSAGLAGAASATSLKVCATNMQGESGLYRTLFFTAFADDAWDAVAEVNSGSDVPSTRLAPLTPKVTI